MIKRIFFAVFAVLAVLFLGFYIWLYPQYEVPVFMYHSLNEARLGEYSVVPLETFRAQMEYIKKNGYTVLRLEEYCRRLKEGLSVPRHSVVITFDDGHRDNTRAVEVLDSLDIPATIFLIVDKIGTEAYLTKEQVVAFLQNTPVDIGSHTMSHAYLPDLVDSEVFYQINESKHTLIEEFGVPVETLTYPVGGFNETVLKEVEHAGYLCACTTNRGFSKEKHLFALRRIKITDRDRGIALWAKLSGYYNVFKKPKNPY
ncbi:MAG: polysaccharide deacetylase family protein [Candidatus Omnitrophica bacterium]|nr:polysaccharide deacetylase family protein [Candidatus Omnitrophota bacterium]